MTSPLVTFEPSSTLAGTPAISSLPDGTSAKKWKPTAPPATNTLPCTWRLLESKSQKPWNHPPIGKRPPVQINDSGKCSTGNAYTTRRASILLLNVKPFVGPLEFHQVHEERRRDYPTSNLLINFVPDSRRFPKGLFGVLFV
jgi:hypothetical protein